MYYKVLCIVYIFFNYNLIKSGGCIFDLILGMVVINKYILYSRFMVVKGFLKFIIGGFIILYGFYYGGLVC